MAILNLEEPGDPFKGIITSALAGVTAPTHEFQHKPRHFKP